jgi:signal transduction histidine kinase
MGAFIKKSNDYAKWQIKKLSIAMIFGSILLLVTNLLPMVTFVRFIEPSNELIYITISEGDLLSNTPASVGNFLFAYNNTHYLLIFSIIPMIVINMLLKREYVNLNYSKHLTSIILSTLYIVAFNLFVFFTVSVNIVWVVLFNILIFIPIIVGYFRRGRQVAAGYSSTGQLDLDVLGFIEEERQNISVYLHDDVLQSLIVMRHLSEDASNIDAIATQLADKIAEIRETSYKLYPLMVEDLGLKHSLHILIDNLGQDYNIDFCLHYSLPQGALPKAVELTVYRVAKELIANAIKHASCQKISVTVAGENDSLCLSITDDGVGFTISDKQALFAERHMGIVSIHKQLEQLGGTMRVVSGKNTGAQFIINIPISKCEKYES